MPIRNYTKLKINQSTDNDKNSNINIENNRSDNHTGGTDKQNDMMNGYISGDRTGSSSAHQFHRSDPDGKIR